MKKTSLMMAITFFILANSILIGQERTEGIDHPIIYTSIMLGGIDIFSSELGVYLNNNIAVSIKWGLFAYKGEFLPFTYAAGIGVNYYFKRKYIINYLSADFFKLYQKYMPGYAFEAVVGNCTNRESGFGFIYEIGIGYSNIKTELFEPIRPEGSPTKYEHRELFGPVIKIGLNFNF